ncbi:ATP-binding protein [Dactylosporangium roseum]|uniref:ATP-binding protein n=1 Tax=Dactylosporangium roseum TaxID=47989 RepID=A0ABY5ZFU0_9ACTN|nr:ATP-binding protein [Dactylosporangium roseum]UWZ39558.1 ATP-binding protein [Dactylosporangium roseum]
MNGPEQEAAGVKPAPRTDPAHALDLEQPFTEGDLYTLRAAVTAHAHAGNIPARTIDSLLLIVGELASNVVQHGGGTGHLRLRRTDNNLICQVSDHGPGIADPELIGLVPVPPTAPGGRGLWIVRQLSTDVSIRCDSTGTTVTVTMPVHLIPGPH